MDNKLKEFIENIDEVELSNFLARTKSSITAKTDVEKIISDTSWIDMVEESIPYLDNIIRNPRRFIVQEENIVPIEKAKVVTEESIRHLAQNTRLIQDVKSDGSVIPIKLLNVYREETVDLYENRFIKSLVDNLYQFVENKLNESDQRSLARVTNRVNFIGENKIKGEDVVINVTLSSKKEDVMDSNKDGHSLETRIEHIRDVLLAFKSSTFIRGLKESQPVHSPIRKTNTILKDQNFVKALELWEYLEKNAIKPITSIDKKTIDRSIEVKDKFALAFYLQSEAITLENVKKKTYKEFDKASISAFINDVVLRSNISETELKNIIVREFKVAKKQKEKEEKQIKRCFSNFIEDYEKRRQKALALLK